MPSGRDFADIRLTAGYFDDPFADVDAYLRTLERYAALGFDTDQHRPVARQPRSRPAGSSALGDEVIPRLRH